MQTDITPANGANATKDANGASRSATAAGAAVAWPARAVTKPEITK
jgi:hypothetical protein